MFGTLWVPPGPHESLGSFGQWRTCQNWKYSKVGFFKVDGAWNLSTFLGPYGPPQVPMKVWDHLANDAPVKIEKFQIWIFQSWQGVNFEHIFGTPWAPQVHTQVWVHFAKDGKKFVFAQFCVSVITGRGNTRPLDQPLWNGGLCSSTMLYLWME